MDSKSIQQKINRAFGSGERPADFTDWFESFVSGLNRGEIRAAEFQEGRWRANAWVKKGILLGFRWGTLIDYGTGSFPYFDKDTYPLRPMQIAAGVRIVPGGTSIRTGCYVAPGVVIMPPAYVNVGAYVGKDTMIDSHGLVGSCAQIGARVHISAAAQIGGVLEPVGALPVVVEDDVLIGGNAGVYEGTIVKAGAVIGAGTVLTGSIPVYDLVQGRILRKTPNEPLVIPEQAVVVPGSRAVLGSEFAREKGLAMACALIVKYKDERTASATALEEALR